MEALAPTWTSRWCRAGVHWFETEGDGRKWHVRKRCPDCRAALRRQEYALAPDPILAYNKARRDANIEDVRRRDRERYAAAPDRKREGGAAWKAANPDKVKEGTKRYNRSEAGRAAHRRGSTKRRARAADAVCAHGVNCFEDAANRMPARCAVRGCRRKDIQADHVVPLAAGGLNCRDNLQPLCGHHNASKRDSDPLVFARRNGMLF